MIVQWWQLLGLIAVAMYGGYQIGWLAREKHLSEHERRAERISERWHRDSTRVD